MVILRPLEYASVRLQLDTGTGSSINPRTFPQGNTLSVLQSTSLRGIYTGTLASVSGAALYRGVYFGLYDTFKFQVPQASLALKFLLGYGVTLASSMLVYPIQVGVTRCQASAAPVSSYHGEKNTDKFKGVMNAILQISRKEGLRALWRGCGLNVALSVGGGLSLVLWDVVKYRG